MTPLNTPFTISTAQSPIRTATARITRFRDCIMAPLAIKNHKNKRAPRRNGAVPDCLVLSLDDLPMLADTLKWMFGEAASAHCGREAALERLFELLIILLFRHLLDHQQLRTGMMAGLADPRLARSLVQIHNAPERAWSIAQLASESNMSRAAYAVHFRDVIGQTPAEYLLSWRISLAQKRLREGKPIALIAEEVGYESPSALARAFRRKTGVSPREWVQGSKRR